MIKDWIKSDNFINGSHLVLGPTRCGKTTFVTMLLFAATRYNKQFNMKYILITMTDSADDMIQRANEFFPDNIDNIIILKSMADLQEQFNDIKTRYQEFENTRYVFYFDDCLSFITDKTYIRFITEFSANHRQYNITALYNLQQIQSTPTVIRSNFASVSLLGKISNNASSIVFKSCNNIDNVFDGSLDFCKFMAKKSKIFGSDRSIVVFKNEGDSCLYSYIVNGSLAKFLAKKKKDKN